MSGKNNRGYAAAFQQLDSVAETYQVDNSPQHQQPQHSVGGSQAFMALDYHVTEGYSGMSHGMQQQQQQHQQSHHHSLVVPNHQFYANSNHHMNTPYQLMLQRHQEHRQQLQQQQQQYETTRVMPFYGDMSTTSNPHASSPHSASFAASFDPLPMNYAAARDRSSSWDEFMVLNASLFQPDPIQSGAPPAPVSAQQSYSSNSTNSMSHNTVQSSSAAADEDAAWLSALSIEVSGLSMEPLSGSEVVQRCQASMDDVSCRYVPCVDFLVQCQQDLRKGQRSCANNAREFFVSYVQPLPGTFYSKNRFLLTADTLQQAMDGLNQLVRDAKGAQRMGSEAVKNHFLGGMKDGESWGLRKWLSRQGNALQICTNLECILTALRRLDKSAESTRKLAAVLRPVALKSLRKLQTGVPESYQEQSSAHPYLPFFHRLEAALRSMSQFEPEKDDVICLDDSDDDDESEIVPVVPPMKRRRSDIMAEEVRDDEDDNQSVKKPAAKPLFKPQHLSQRQTTDEGDGSSSGESDDDSVVEIVNAFAVSANTASDRDSDREWSVATTSPSERGQARDGPIVWPLPLVDRNSVAATAEIIATNIDRLAEYFDSGQQAVIRPITAPHGTFWDGHRFARALRLFSSLFRQPESLVFVERVDEDVLIQSGHPPFSHVIKHPLSLRDIASSLIWNIDAEGNTLCGKDGQLPVWDLRKWNMWKGMDLLQAIDLVFLNSLAYGKRVRSEKKSLHRSATNKLRKILWDEINRVIQMGAGNDASKRKSITPTRRSESSGFIVYKIQE